MLQKKEYQQHLQKLMLQKKEYQQQQQLKKPIVENQTSGKTKTNATKEGVPATTKLPVAPTKTNATKEGVPATPTKTNATKEGIQQQQSYQ